MNAKIAVVGAGLIGRAWAIVFARAGHPVADRSGGDGKRRNSREAASADFSEPIFHQRPRPSEARDSRQLSRFKRLWRFPATAL